MALLASKQPIPFPVSNRIVEESMKHFDYAIGLVKDERIRQEKKWQTRTDGVSCAGNPNLPLSCAILGEEFGEVCRAMLEGKPGDMLEEAIHTAAVATAIAEYLLGAGVKVNGAQ